MPLNSVGTIQQPVKGSDCPCVALTLLQEDLAKALRGDGDAFLQSGSASLESFVFSATQNTLCNYPLISNI